MRYSTIISIGDELTAGRVCNTNAVFIAQFVARYGIVNKKVSMVPDSKEQILNTLQDSLNYDLVFVTGGLGPTHDDLTKKAAVDFFSTELVEDADLKAHLKHYFKDRKIRMSNINSEQALFPENAEIVPNEIGTASGMHFYEKGTHFYFIPGVPAEMKRMLEEHISPELDSQKSAAEIYYEKVRTFGIAESELYSGLQNWITKQNEIKVSFLPQMPGVDIFLESSNRANLNNALEYISNSFDEYIFGFNADEPHQILGDYLSENDLTIAVAESCTGGLIGHSLTNRPGSSDYFLGGVIAYSNQIKIDMLDVNKNTIAEQGAVSDKTAIEMAVGVRNNFKADLGLSTTGIAGPTGGSKTKPVGTVWIGIAGPNEQKARHYIYSKDRLTNKQAFTKFALLNTLKIIKRG
ncbi:MAG: CinA family nicotinamide mononucleotide deamidase-related protein [Candidatus Marinimicrobia bacterium]|nr:CinA family nicotinamide mononucleotide deamidase-related protein [Candidatus Neomarinimicrobiota bacterium]